MSKVLSFYIIADLSRYNAEEDVAVDKHTFDLSNPDDVELLEEYTDEELNEDTFYDACMLYLKEMEIDAYDQRLCPSLLLTEEQFCKVILKFNFTLLRHGNNN
jgi:hypothetical protein